MQCGPIRHTAQRPAGAPQTLELVSRTHQLEGLPADLPIQELMRRLVEDQSRSDRIVAEALACWEAGRKLLLLSERTGHITAIANALADQVPNLFLLHGRLSARQRSATLAALEAVPRRRPVSCWPPGDWWVKASTIRHSTPCCWRCPCRGKARCSNTPAACTGIKLGKPACASSTGSTSAIRCRNACGSGGCGVIGPWGMG